MGPALSRATAVNDLAAARALIKSSTNTNAIVKSFVPTCAVSGATSELLAARRSYSAFLSEGDSVKYPISSGFLSGGYSSSSSSFSSITDFLLSLLAKVQTAATRCSQALINVAQYLLNNPRVVVAGSVSLLAISGITYLVVKKSILSSSNTQATFHQNNAPTSFHDPPDHLCCPISGELFEDPVSVSTGHTYERLCIEQWIQSRVEAGEEPTCPMTRLPISLDTIRCNFAIKKAVEAYLEDLTSKKKESQVELPSTE
jgi:hypothetical protein